MLLDDSTKPCNATLVETATQHKGGPNERRDGGFQSGQWQRPGWEEMQPWAQDPWSRPPRAGRGRREPLEPSEGIGPCDTLLADSWSPDPGEDIAYCPKAPHLWSLISSARKPVGTQNAWTGPAEENQRNGASKGQLDKAQGQLWVHCPQGPYSNGSLEGACSARTGEGVTYFSTLPCLSFPEGSSQ